MAATPFLRRSLRLSTMSAFAVCAAGVAMLASSKPSNAQVGLSPLILQESAQRGQSSGFINLINGGSEEQRVRLYAEPFTYAPEGGLVTIEPEAAEVEDAANLVPYLQFAPRELVLAPGQRRRVRYVVRFAPDLPEAEYRAVLFAEPLQATASGQQGVGIITRVGATLYVQNGDAAAALDVASASWNLEKQQLQLQVQNDGGAMARPVGQWQLSRSGAEVAAGEVQSMTVLAGNERFIPLSLEGLDPFQPGPYQLTGTLAWQGQQQPFAVEVEIPVRSGSKDLASTDSAVQKP